MSPNLRTPTFTDKHMGRNLVLPELAVVRPAWPSPRVTPSSHFQDQWGWLLGPPTPTPSQAEASPHPFKQVREERWPGDSWVPTGQLSRHKATWLQVLWVSGDLTAPTRGPYQAPATLLVAHSETKWRQQRDSSAFTENVRRQ